MDIRHYPGGRGALAARYVKDTLIEPGIVKALRTRLTLAQVNAGAVLLAALPTVRWQLLDFILVAVGGAAAGATSLDITATVGASVVRPCVAAIAALGRSVVARAGDTNVVVLADGASFVSLDVNTAVNCVSVGTMTTATHFDVTIFYQANIA